MGGYSAARSGVQGASHDRRAGPGAKFTLNFPIVLEDDGVDPSVMAAGAATPRPYHLQQRIPRGNATTRGSVT